jgi:hypothetical protein
VLGVAQVEKAIGDADRVPFAGFHPAGGKESAKEK